ncbi:MAG: glycine/sarcosine/betaine reductase selenoprotein B family protein [Pseudomonadota bacterium]
MPADLDAAMGFAPEHDRPVPYIDRTHSYYRALGYDRPYRYAQFADVPFQPLSKSLETSRVALITTAAPYDPAKGDQGPWSAYNSAAKFYRIYTVPTNPEPDLRISHVGIDRKHTSQKDMRSWLPLGQLKWAEEDGRIGALIPQVFGAPTNRSHRVTLEQDAPEMLDRLRAAGADAAVIAANCPICHQTCSLIARHLEANGIATVVMGCAKDIVETCGVPRFLFSDFPLGNPAGRPDDEASQAATLDMALSLLQAAPGPRTTWQSPIRWSEDADWKLDYSNVDRIAPEELDRRRVEFLRQKEIAHARRAADTEEAAG